MRRTVVCMALAGCALAGCPQTQKVDGETTLPKVTLQLGSETFEVEIAATPEQRRHGLMDRTSLDRNAGMLFVFDEEQPQAFWMKNTLVALDIAFIRASGRIATIRTMLPRNEALYTSSEPCLYALEVPAGTFARLGIREADTIEIPPKVAADAGR